MIFTQATGIVSPDIFTPKFKTVSTLTFLDASVNYLIFLHAYIVHNFDLLLTWVF